MREYANSWKSWIKRQRNGYQHSLLSLGLTSYLDPLSSFILVHLLGLEMHGLIASERKRQITNKWKHLDSEVNERGIALQISSLLLCFHYLYPDYYLPSTVGCWRKMGWRGERNGIIPLFVPHFQGFYSWRDRDNGWVRRMEWNEGIDRWQLLV